MSRRGVAVLAIMVLIAGLMPATASAREATARVYIVRMSGEPAVAYEGGVPGYRATAPRAGRKIDPTSTDVVRYVAHLSDRHARTLRAVGGGTPIYDYAYAFNGFAARLSRGQARRLARQAGVLAVTPNQTMKLDTVSTPEFLGLSGGDGAWSMVGGVANAGEGMVIGIIDSGIWPENPSFAANGANGSKSRDAGYTRLKDWHGRCQGGEAFPSTLCNQKIVGARYFAEGWAGFYLNLPATGGRWYSGRQVIDILFPEEVISPRDVDGHGSHTASTAAGNDGVSAVVDGVFRGTVSGMAPRARIAVYKSCWGTGATGGCAVADNVAAIDAATADGVDALNYSVSGATDTLADPVEIAFLYAARAGILISASAGNEGPGPGTVAHNSPWLMTTGAGTHDRQYTATLTLGNDATFTGVGLGAALASHPVVTAADAAVADADPTLVAQCYSAASNGGDAVLDPGAVAGKIVVCDRGGNGRADKSLAVKDAGGVGMILLNTSPSSLNSDLHHVPTIHLPETDRAAILDYIAGAGASATAALGAGARIPGVAAPDVAAFSSRGPALASGANLIKPDIFAPGVDILAAVAPPANGGRDFDIYSGTSMSSPHMAGIMTLVKQRHPTWSPAAVKSALMTTASTVRSGGSPIQGGVFAYGSGHVDPRRALDPGLVYDAGMGDWVGFLCATEPDLLAPDVCATFAGAGFDTTDPSQLNYPSIAVGDLLGTRTVGRVVTSVETSSQTYTATVDVPGFTATVTPASFTIAPGATQELSITFDRADAPFAQFATGSLTLTSQAHTVRSPVALRPLGLIPPAKVEITTGTTSTSYPVRLGYGGPVVVSTRGLIGSDRTSGTLLDDPTNLFVPGGPGIAAIPVTITADMTFVRLQLDASSVTEGSDFDLFLCRATASPESCAIDPYELSAGLDSNELIELPTPEAGDYVLYVHAFEAVGGSSPWRVDRWLLGGTSAGNLTAAASPSSGTIGGASTITLTRDGDLATGRYLGAVDYGGDGATAPQTIVWVFVP